MTSASHDVTLRFGKCMKSATKRVVISSVAALVAGAILTPASPVHAANNAEQVRALMAPTLEQTDQQRAYTKTWTTYYQPWDGSDTFSAPDKGFEYIILGGQDSKLAKARNRPYEYGYREEKLIGATKPTAVKWQGAADNAALGGSWIRRGDVRRASLLPANLRGVGPDTIISNLETAPRGVGRLTDDISGVSPVDMARSIADLTALPVVAGSLNIEGNDSAFQRTRASWQTSSYTNAFGDACSGARVTARFDVNGILSTFNVEEVCAGPNGAPLMNFIDGHVQSWDSALDAPEPNVSLAD